MLAVAVAVAVTVTGCTVAVGGAVVTVGWEPPRGRSMVGVDCACAGSCTETYISIPYTVQRQYKRDFPTPKGYDVIY